MKIAILSNNHQVKLYIEKYFSNITFIYFTNDFYNVLDSEYDICIIDVEYTGKDTIQLARRYKRLYGKSKIIYMSIDSKIIYKLIKESMFYFINANTLQEDIKNLYSKYKNEQSNSIEIVYKRKKYTIELNAIVYMVSARNTVFIHTIDNNCYEVYSSLSQILNKIDSNNFYRVNQQEVINLFYVKQIIGRNIILDNGIETIVSRGKIKDFRVFYRNYKGIQ